MNLEQALKNTSSLWVLQVVKMVISFGVSIVSIRYLGPDNYGILATGSALVILFSALASLPQGELVIREFAKAEDGGLGKVISTAFTLQTIGGVVQVFAALAAVILLRYDANVQHVVLLLSLSYVLRPFVILISALEFDGQFGTKARLEFTFFILGVMFNLFLVAVSASLLWFAAAALINSAITAVILMSFVRYAKDLAPRKRFSNSLAITFLKDGWPLVLSGVAVSIYLRTDVVFISKLLGDTSAGWYTAGIRFAEVLYFFPMIIVTIALPTLSRQFVDARASYYDLTTKVASSIVLLGVALASGLYVGAAFGLPVLLGDRFLQSIGVVQIAAWTIALVGIASLVNSSLILQQQTRVPLYGSVLGAILNVVLNAVLIPRLGITGGIIATLAAQVVSLGLMIYLLKDGLLRLALLRGASPVQLVSFSQTLVHQLLNSLARRT